MSVKRITVVEDDSTGNSVTVDDTLQATFTRTAYDVTLEGTPTNCTVTPSTVSSGNAIFTADFSASTTNSAFSFRLKNSAPNFGGNPSAYNFINAGQNGNYSTQTPYFGVWTVLKLGSLVTKGYKVNGHDVPFYCQRYSQPFVDGAYNTPQSQSGTAYIQGSEGDRYLRLTSSVQFSSTFAQYGANRIINQLHASSTFSLNAGDKIVYQGAGGLSNHFRIYLLDTVNGTWTQMGHYDDVANNSGVAATSTYRICLFNGAHLPQYDTQEIEGGSIDKFVAFDSNGVQGADLIISGVVSESPSALIKTTQVQETDDALVHLFELKLPEPRSTTLYFHDGLNFDSGTGKNIYFPSKDGTSVNEYIAFPITIDGIETKAGGGSNRPVLSMANIPVLSRTLANNTDGTDDETNLEQVFTDEGMGSAEDFLGGTLTYRSTLLKYTFNASNAPPVGALPIEYPSFSYSLDRISREESASIQFELATPADLDNVMLPNRRAVGKYCAWEYQGALYGRGGCTAPANSFGAFFDEEDKLITAQIGAASGPFYNETWNTNNTYTAGQRVKKVFSGAAGGWRIYEALIAVPAGKDPETNSLYWKRIDVCGKRIRSCKMRFHTRVSEINTDTSLAGTLLTDATYFNTDRSLPFGGFPGSKKFK